MRNNLQQRGVLSSLPMLAMLISLQVNYMTMVDYVKFLNSTRFNRFTICGEACPFHASMLMPASQAGPTHESAGVGEVS